MKFRIYRYDPEKDAKPWYKDYDVALEPTRPMLLDALMRVKEVDDTCRSGGSCREGVCGSDAMNINGKNGLAASQLKDAEGAGRACGPLPGSGDPRPDRRHEPVLQAVPLGSARISSTTRRRPRRERLQSPEEREELDGLYECILCACCSTACPSFWWNPGQVRRARRIAAARIASSRTAATRR
jgi:succinate dehydrogenase / fumarate reductase iron-sulfur subunit